MLATHGKPKRLNDIRALMGPGGPNLILRAQKVYLYPNSTSLMYRMKVGEMAWSTQHSFQIHLHLIKYGVFVSISHAILNYQKGF